MYIKWLDVANKAIHWLLTWWGNYAKCVIKVSEQLRMGNKSTKMPKSQKFTNLQWKLLIKTQMMLFFNNQCSISSFLWVNKHNNLQVCVVLQSFSSCPSLWDTVSGMDEGWHTTLIMQSVAIQQTMQVTKLPMSSDGSHMYWPTTHFEGTTILCCGTGMSILEKKKQKCTDRMYDMAWHVWCLMGNILVKKRKLKWKLPEGFYMCEKTKASK